jgi:phosphoribosylanthranilate isomerase
MFRGRPAEFRVKICGVARAEDALAVIDAKADAIGLNFYEQSPRFLNLHRALEIIGALGAAPIARVGVFVNMGQDAIELIASSLALCGIQLHGDEPPELVAHLAAPKTMMMQALHPSVIRARRMDDRGVAAIAADLQACAIAGATPTALLIDAATPGRYGGTGETVSWVGLADHRRWLGETPLILAGGLTPDNVAEAIRIVRPAAVDVASGVESAPGKKDPVKVRDFVANALGAFEALEGG